MNDLKIMGQLVALLRAGLSFHQAEQAAHVQELSEIAGESYRYLRGVALASGGPPAEAMARVREVIQGNQARLQAVELANASPRATVRLVLWLPIAALVMGQLSGMGSLAVLLRSPIALTSVLVGALLLALGSYWSARMIRAARAQEVDHGIYFDAISIALNSGLAIDHAKALAGEANTSVADDLKEMIELSKTTGAALGKLLIDKADEIRAEVSYNKALALEKLSVKLMVPLGVSVLPAFALIAVVPLAMSFLVNQNGG